jgi:hypothetical protein
MELEVLSYLNCPSCGGNGNEDGEWCPYGGWHYGQRTVDKCSSCGGSGRLKPFGLRTFHSTFVSPRADGTVKQADVKGALELLETIVMKDGRVAFRTMLNTYLTAMSADSNWEVRQHYKPHGIEEWEKLEVIAVNDRQLTLKSHHGYFLSATDQGGMTQQPWLMTWEMFEAPTLVQASRAKPER